VTAGCRPPDTAQGKQGTLTDDGQEELSTTMSTTSGTSAAQAQTGYQKIEDWTQEH
jgi:hypothetical protein